MKKTSFTLVETLIVTTIFVFVAVFTVEAFTNGSKLSKVINTQAFLYGETEILMDELDKLISENKIDFDAHYNRSRGQSWENSDTTYTDGGGPNTSAFCFPPCNSIDDYKISELILLNNTKNRRIVIALETSDSDNLLARLDMEGSDTDDDFIADSWTCADIYSCPAGDIPLESDLTDGNSDFAYFQPFSPESLNILEFDLIINPIEKRIDTHPYALLVLKTTLSKNYGAGLFWDPPTITLQRTVSTFYEQ